MYFICPLPYTQNYDYEAITLHFIVVMLVMIHSTSNFLLFLWLNPSPITHSYNRVISSQWHRFTKGYITYCHNLCQLLLTWQSQEPRVDINLGLKEDRISSLLIGWHITINGLVGQYIYSISNTISSVVVSKFFIKIGWYNFKYQSEIKDLLFIR